MGGWLGNACHACQFGQRDWWPVRGDGFDDCKSAADHGVVIENNLTCHVGSNPRSGDTSFQ
jgi:hypothetical protein